MVRFIQIKSMPQKALWILFAFWTLLTMAFGDFITAYTIAAWLCWVPNIFVAWLMVRRIDTLQPGGTKKVEIAF